MAARAVSWYRGELLPEDGAAEWVVGERERLRLAAAQSAEASPRCSSAAMTSPRPPRPARSG